MAIGEDTRRQRDLGTVPSQGALTEDDPAVPEPPRMSDEEHPERAVLLDRHWPGRTFDTVDRIVIARTGIFVVDVVGWSGPVEVTPDLLEVNGRSRHAAVTSAQETARNVALLLATELRDHVFPVICLSREEAVTGWVKAVRVCSSTTIDDLIEAREAVLSDDQISQVAADLHAALPSNHSTHTERSRAGDHEKTKAVPRAAAVPSSPVPWRRSRAGRITQGGMAVGLVAALTFLGFHLTVVDSASDNTPPKQHQRVGPVDRN